MTDRRVHFANGSIAHSSLSGKIAGRQVMDGTLMRIGTPLAGIYASDQGRGLERQVLMGHPVTILQIKNGKGFGRTETMGYVGYFDSEALDTWQGPTHRVRARATLLFDEPDFKSPDPVAISLGSLLNICGQDGRYARLADGRYALNDHLCPCTLFESDPVLVAERLIGTPYLWGGNSAFGIDCSGLVQIACHACNIPCPGDSDLQQAHFPAATGTYRRGDLLFWKGHVALVCNAASLIHANAHHMAVAYEPIDEALLRIEAQGGGPLTGHARLLPNAR